MCPLNSRLLLPLAVRDSKYMFGFLIYSRLEGIHLVMVLFFLNIVNANAFWIENQPGDLQENAVFSTSSLVFAAIFFKSNTIRRILFVFNTKLWTSIYILWLMFFHYHHESTNKCDATINKSQLKGGANFSLRNIFINSFTWFNLLCRILSMSWTYGQIIKELNTAWTIMLRKRCDM